MFQHPYHLVSLLIHPNVAYLTIYNGKLNNLNEWGLISNDSLYVKPGNNTCTNGLTLY